MTQTENTEKPVVTEGAADTPGWGRKPMKRTRMRLRTVHDCDAAVQMLIREWRSGLLDSSTLSRVVNCLSILARMKSDTDLEARLMALEQAAAARIGRAA
jgi:hypothetical protein